MIVCKDLKKSFDSPEDLYKYLQENKSDIIAFKKAQIQKSIDKNASITAKPLSFKKLNGANKSLELDDNFYYIAVNSTWILDSHKDLHIVGIWNKTVKEQQGKNYLVDTHIMSIGTTIARKEHIEMFTAVVPFSMIGKSYDGDTEVLIYKIAKDKIISEVAKEWLESGDSIEASVRMRYMDLVLAMNSDREEDKEEKKNYLNWIDNIANKSDFEEDIRYFWVIKQAQNIGESSLVLFGSNHSTGLLDDEHKDEADDESLQKIEAEKSLQKKRAYLLNT